MLYGADTREMLVVTRVAHDARRGPGRRQRGIRETAWFNAQRRQRGGVAVLATGRGAGDVIGRALDDDAHTRPTAATRWSVVLSGPTVGDCSSYWTYIVSDLYIDR